MFSKALFKQSCKANGTMWSIITFAVCFMLACVMLISGGGGIGDTKNAIEDTIIVQEIDSQIEKRAINYYNLAASGEKEFDSLFVNNSTDALTYHAYFSGWLAQMPDQSAFPSADYYAAAINAWKEKMPAAETDAAKLYLKNYSDWQEAAPKRESFNSDEEYAAAVEKYKAQNPVSDKGAVAAAYTVAVKELQDGIYKNALTIDEKYTEDSAEAKEMLGAVMYVINPNGTFNDFYTENGEEAPADYDITSLIAHMKAGDAAEYIDDSEREDYRNTRAENGSAVFLAGNLTKAENVENIVNNLSSFGVTKEKYDSFGYTYDSLKHTAVTTAITYNNRYEYEIGQLKEKLDSGEIASEEEFNKAVAAKNDELIADISDSLLASLPEEVSDALEEIGQADLYTLIVGSIFYKLAGLLLPIIYMIMASNNLISGQVDSGSMAYVLSTSTRRSTVVFTQAVYLIGSLLAMFGLTTATGFVCLAIVNEDVELTYGKLALLNVGAFLVLFALSGLCFFTSCVFDRSKRSMAIGGGLSIFALVAAMLGLFGSPVIPSVVRLDALNHFNYTTIISLFDVISIMDETGVFIWKFCILAVLGLLGYIVGSMRFTKKDLPL